MALPPFSPRICPRKHQGASNELGSNTAANMPSTWLLSFYRFCYTILILSSLTFGTLAALSTFYKNYGRYPTTVQPISPVSNIPEILASDLQIFKREISESYEKRDEENEPQDRGFRTLDAFWDPENLNYFIHGHIGSNNSFKRVKFILFHNGETSVPVPKDKSQPQTFLLNQIEIPNIVAQYMEEGSEDPRIGLGGRPKTTATSTATSIATPTASSSLVQTGTSTETQASTSSPVDAGTSTETQAPIPVTSNQRTPRSELAAETLLELIAKQEFINTESVGIYLGDLQKEDKGKNIYRSITLGGVDVSKFNPESLRTQKDEGINVTEVTMNINTSISTAGSKVLNTHVDSISADLNFGEPYIRIPETWLKSIKDLLVQQDLNREHPDPPPGSEKKIYIKELPGEESCLQLTIQGFNTTISIPISQMAIAVKDKKNLYELLIASTSEEHGPITLGAPFFRAAYVFLDYLNQEISIAPALFKVKIQSNIPIGLNGRSIQRYFPSGVDKEKGGKVESALLQEIPFPMTTATITLAPDYTSVQSTELTKTEITTIIATSSETGSSGSFSQGSTTGAAVATAGIVGFFFLLTLGTLIWTLIRNSRKKVPFIIPGPQGPSGIHAQFPSPHSSSILGDLQPNFGNPGSMSEIQRASASARLSASARASGSARAANGGVLV